MDSVRDEPYFRQALDSYALAAALDFCFMSKLISLIADAFCQHSMVKVDSNISCHLTVSFFGIIDEI